jgi:hypothetical protein
MLRHPTIRLAGALPSEMVPIPAAGRRLARLRRHIVAHPAAAASLPVDADRAMADELRARAVTLTSPSAVLPHTPLDFEEIDDTPTKHKHLDVLASEEELEQLAARGFLVRPGLLSAAGIERLGAALAELAAHDNVELGTTQRASIPSSVFGAWGPRWLMERHPAFIELWYWQPLLSVVRAMLGPMVRVRHCQARVSWPSDQTTLRNDAPWHHHVVRVPKPLPPFWAYPHRFDTLIYLDPLDADNGELALVPGSHLLLHTELVPKALPADTEAELVTGAAGTCVIMHRQMWHRAMPNALSGGQRRMILIQWAPVEGRSSPKGRETKPKGEASCVTKLLREAVAHGDGETLELLGTGGYQ